MTLKKIDPDTLAPPHGHAQVVVASGSRIVFVSGQVGIDADERLVGAGYRAQGHRAAMNAYAAVTGAGGTPADIVRFTVYVVDPAAANLEELYAGLGDAARSAGAKRTAMTLIGVTGLSMPGALVEIEVTAVID
ncbi:RidA family protein [Actinomadura sp. KC216]|uniref:RidA family protein n=1 Tax=Actinomadura sp. KC216 TaxID=2530370 RepID=UPI001405141B|nr:RidA family protein [Actinomadura sp. KC216]